MMHATRAASPEAHETSLPAPLDANRLDAHFDVAIVGEPVCGKTSLLETAIIAGNKALQGSTLPASLAAARKRRLRRESSILSSVPASIALPARRRLSKRRGGSRLSSPTSHSCSSSVTGQEAPFVDTDDDAWSMFSTNEKKDDSDEDAVDNDDDDDDHANGAPDRLGATEAVLAKLARDEAAADTKVSFYHRNFVHSTQLAPVRGQSPSSPRARMRELRIGVRYWDTHAKPTEKAAREKICRLVAGSCCLVVYVFDLRRRETLDAVVGWMQDMDRVRQRDLQRYNALSKRERAAMQPPRPHAPVAVLMGTHSDAQGATHYPSLQAMAKEQAIAAGRRRASMDTTSSPSLGSMAIPERPVSQVQARSFAGQHRMKRCFVVSNETGRGVDAAFTVIERDLMHMIENVLSMEALGSRHALQRAAADLPLGARLGRGIATMSSQLAIQPRMPWGAPAWPRRLAQAMVRAREAKTKERRQRRGKGDKPPLPAPAAEGRSSDYFYPDEWTLDDDLVMDAPDAVPQKRRRSVLQV